MTPFDCVADVSPLVTATFGLAGTLIGGVITAGGSLIAARQSREAAASSWVRDTRREVYERLLTAGQEYLIAQEARHEAPSAEGITEACERAHSDFFTVYADLQTIAGRPVIEAARVYAYRLLELKEGRLGAEHFWEVARLVRLARHDTIDAIRKELKVAESARPLPDFNPFQGTSLQDAYGP